MIVAILIFLISSALLTEVFLRCWRSRVRYVVVFPISAALINAGVWTLLLYLFFRDDPKAGSPSVGTFEMGTLLSLCVALLKTWMYERSRSKKIAQQTRCSEPGDNASVASREPLAPGR
jgi:hypothetical protein